MFTTSTNTPAPEIRRRISQLQTELGKNDLDGALILQPTDLFYYSGTIQQSHLYVPAEGEALLLARKSFERAQAESPIDRIIPLASPKKLPQLLEDNGLSFPGRLGMELDVLPVNLFTVYKNIFPSAQIVDVAPVIRMQRAVKSSYERDILKQAGRFADQMMAHVPDILKEGLTEIELAGQVEAYARKLGHQGVVRMRLWGNELFYGHLLSGPSAAVPSYLASPTGGGAVTPAVAQGSGFTVIKPHEPVLVDYVFAYNGYISDQTRIFSIGDLPEDLVKAHQAMLDIQSHIKTMARPGIFAGQIYDAALDMAADAGFADYFMGVGPQRIRFVGHGVGLELDEFPFLAQGQNLALQENMVIALEPKLILPGRGVVGIENSHVVTPDGLTPLTAYPDMITTV
jgi:Xaa-Pro aminopeptidase